MKWNEWNVIAVGITVMAAGACGSNVTVDQGAGGATGAGGSASAGMTGGLVTSSGQGTTAGVGPASGSGAGASGVTTGAGASGVTTGAGATGASAGPSTGAVTSSASSGVGGGPPSSACSDCAQVMVQNGCATQYNACINNFACSKLLECHSSCDWTASCNAMCDSIIPSGVPLLVSMMKCVMCDSCSAVCSDSTVYKSYCP
jgi:hypothetical protein